MLCVRYLCHEFKEFEKISTFFNFIYLIYFVFKIVITIGMLTSVPFIIITILIYILLPELHNLHGNCMICYLICLVIAYILTAWINLDGWNYVNPLLCKCCGHLMYFMLLSAFFWSNVISFDLWRNLWYHFNLFYYSLLKYFKLFGYFFAVARPSFKSSAKQRDFTCTMCTLGDYHRF